MTSVKGRMAISLDTTYAMLKWAGEAFSDILRLEMKRFGVKVVIIEPGDFGGLTGMGSAEAVSRSGLTGKHQTCAALFWKNNLF